MITVLPDFREEGWHSMDLCADMLVENAPKDSVLKVGLPSYRKILGFLPAKKAINFDRWYNRWKVYPRHVEKLAESPGFFHIVDHSYAHLANHLPEGRVGVYCHDLDAFKCILTPDQEPRPDWFIKMMGRVFDGFKKAKLVFCSTSATREKLLALGHWKEGAIHTVPYGVAAEFIREGEKEPGAYLLHVGSCIPRKRMDVLISSFARVAKTRTDLKLIQAGGNFSERQKRQISELGLDDRVEQRQNLTREDLARLYRGAECLVIPSESEGFGLPVIEGLACGTKVVSSDIPALREVGGTDIGYFPVGDSNACAEKVLNCLETPDSNRKIPSGKWSWSSHARRICQAYGSLEI